MEMYQCSWPLRSYPCYVTPGGSSLSYWRTSSLLPARNTWRMLRLQIFPCACTHAGCYGLADLLLHLHTCGMLHQQIFSGTCGHMLGSCASRSSPALAHMRVAMLADLLLHLHRSHARILRCRIFSCTCPHYRVLR